MASIFDRYGLKEVSNVSFFALDADAANGIAQGDLVLYLDSLKVSTIEQTAEQTDAKGGWGNSKLISWDYGKEMTITLEDALLSPEFLRVMVGGSIKKATSSAGVDVNFVSAVQTASVSEGAATIGTATLNDTYSKSHTIASNQTFRYIDLTSGIRGQASYSNSVITLTQPGTGTQIAQGDKIRLFWTESVVESTGHGAVEITISPDTFAGTYKIVGDAMLKGESGAQEAFQWIVNKGKVSSAVTFTMEAEGDPATFSMTVNVLRSEDNGNYEMMKMVKYN